MVLNVGEGMLEMIDFIASEIHITRSAAIRYVIYEQWKKMQKDKKKMETMKRRFLKRQAKL